MYRGRGSSPSVGGSESSNANSSTVSHYHSYLSFYRHHPYYDSNFVLMQIIVEVSILIFCFIAYFITYKTSFVDPIETIKSTYMNTLFVAILLSVGLIGLTRYFSKSKKTLIRNLKVIIFLSIIAMIGFIGTKISFDQMYQEETFSTFYENSDLKQKETLYHKQTIHVGLSGVQIMDLKQVYIEDNMTAYHFFTYKSMAVLLLYGILIAFTIFMIYRLVHKEEKKEQLLKDDTILFDEEENVKF